MRPRKASGSNWGRLGGLGRLWVSLRASWEGLGGFLTRYPKGTKIDVIDAT